MDQEQNQPEQTDLQGTEMMLPADALQELMNQPPLIELSGVVTINEEENSCEFKCDQDVDQLPVEAEKVVTSFRLDGTNDTYLHLEKFAHDHQLTQERFDEIIKAKGGDEKLILNINGQAFLRSNFLD